MPMPWKGSELWSQFWVVKPLISLLALCSLKTWLYTLDHVPENVYRGQVIPFKRALGQEIKSFTGLAWRKFWSLNFTLSKDRFHKTASKKELLEGCVLLTPLYVVHMGSQSSKDKKIILICQHKMERTNLGVTTKDKVWNTKVRSMERFRDTGTWVKMSKGDGEDIQHEGANQNGHTQLQHGNQGQGAGRPEIRWSDVFKMTSWQWTSGIQIHLL